ncbi:hypothetical protein DVQ18_15600 [Yersinia enterocolitica]|nr:hypothetical protein [Yersinia enterocolitica]EKN5954200.1 hypothetical protein [Yersinia enterocolitica]EKN6105413.1 hypothetical protein [Yersinia enterocolitica]
MIYPKSLELQVGSQQTHPAELTQVSDSGKRAQLTTLRLQGRRVGKKKTLADKGKRLKFSGLQTTMSVPHSTLCPVCDEDIQHRLHGQ